MNLHHLDGRMNPFYQVGNNANTKGISAYIMGNEDKKQLIEKRLQIYYSFSNGLPGFASPHHEFITFVI
jgi:hypothetical protein